MCLDDRTPQGRQFSIAGRRRVDFVFPVVARALRIRLRRNQCLLRPDELDLPVAGLVEFIHDPAQQGGQPIDQFSRDSEPVALRYPVGDDSRV